MREAAPTSSHDVMPERGRCSRRYELGMIRVNRDCSVLEQDVKRQFSWVAGQCSRVADSEVGRRESWPSN
eukprot:2187569-Rhodomonas_salina.4